jgi:hypothetical protein
MEFINNEVMMTCEQYNAFFAKFGDVEICYDGGFFICNNLRSMYLNQDLSVKKLGTIIMIKNNVIKHVQYNTGFKEGKHPYEMSEISRHMSPAFKSMLDSDVDFEISESKNDVHIYYFPHIFNRPITHVKVFRNHKPFYQNYDINTLTSDMIITFSLVEDQDFDVFVKKYNYTFKKRYEINGDEYLVVAFRV